MQRLPPRKQIVLADFGAQNSVSLSNDVADGVAKRPERLRCVCPQPEPYWYSGAVRIPKRR
jgi:hypothetical protein